MRAHQAERQHAGIITRLLDIVDGDVAPPKTAMAARVEGMFQGWPIVVVDASRAERCDEELLAASKQAVNQLLHDAAIQACMENWGSNAKSCSMVPGSPAGAAPAGAAVCRSCTVTFSCHRTGSILK